MTFQSHGGGCPVRLDPNCGSGRKSLRINHSSSSFVLEKIRAEKVLLLFSKVENIYLELD
jgi:hypothetical protein